MSAIQHVVVNLFAKIKLCIEIIRFDLGKSGRLLIQTSINIALPVNVRYRAAQNEFRNFGGVRRVYCDNVNNFDIKTEFN